MTPLFYAVQSGNLEIMDFLVEEKKVDYEHKELMDRTPFYWACCLGEIKIIEYLNNKKININQESKK
jgi:exosome complex exonuclease RRP6